MRVVIFILLISPFFLHGSIFLDHNHLAIDGTLGNGALIASSQKNNSRTIPNLSAWSDVSHRIITLISDSIGLGVAASSPSTEGWFPLFCAANSFTSNNLSISGQGFVVVPTFVPATIPTPTDANGILIFALGVNDSRTGASTVTYRANISTAVQQAITNGWSPNRILICGPYWLAGSDNTNYTAQCLSVAQQFHTMYVDLNAAIAAACDPPTQYISGDNIHPTTAGQLVIKNVMQAINLTPQ